MLGERSQLDMIRSEVVERLLGRAIAENGQEKAFRPFLDPPQPMGGLQKGTPMHISLS